MYSGKKILVYGVGKSGKSVAKLLSKDNEVTIIDEKELDNSLKEELNNYNIEFKLETDVNVCDFDLIVRSPGILPTNNLIKEALDKNIYVTNEVEIAYKYLPNCKIIAVTGSNGKTTTTTIIYKLLSKIMDNIHLGGNIGIPLCDLVENVKAGDVLVLEISDHQLFDIKDFKPNIAVLTNLCPTHLDFHGSYEKYMAVKKKIFNNQSEEDIAIINYCNLDSVNLIKDIKSNKRYFNGIDAYLDNNMIYVDNKEIISLDDIKLKGQHNYENIMAALLVMNEFNLDKNVVKEVLKNFNGVEHRLEFVKEYNKILFYNDSKATNPTSTIIAINSFNKPIHLILGGFERSQDFNELNDYLNNVKCIYAVGEVSNRIESWAKENNIEVFNAKTLEKAVLKIKEKVKSEEVVLLSPASASWDQYDKFETRGEEFKKLVEKYFN